MKLVSSAFAPGATIPARHTCEGDDLAPPLAWSDPPPATRSFALVVDDPDAPDPAAPTATWVHWVLYDIPAAVRSLAEGDGVPDGARCGRNDWHDVGYGGPCPPAGRHRYVFKLYALDTVLGDLHTPNKAQLVHAMRDHVLAQADLVGTYQKRH